ncbi:hypothetical protein [Rhizobacter sp. Root1221]|uniref:hypothetical protein n=1 Tax=Rhizobacter sp. Root1221 TaxID=1736433 RepID=UPI000ACAF414|nr:hypothetical protein [Rhizobacter sp. Root1221]
MKPARLFLAKYTLRNGARGTLHVIATCSCDAVVVAIDTFGGNLRTCSVCAHPSP